MGLRSLDLPPRPPLPRSRRFPDRIAAAAVGPARTETEGLPAHRAGRSLRGPWPPADVRRYLSVALVATRLRSPQAGQEAIRADRPFGAAAGWDALRVHAAGGAVGRLPCPDRPRRSGERRPRDPHRRLWPARRPQVGGAEGHARSRSDRGQCAACRHLARSGGDHDGTI